VFSRILVAVDESDRARLAISFATDLANQFGASLYVLRVAEEKARHQRRPGVDRMAPRRESRGEVLRVPGVTRTARDHLLVSGIERAAAQFGADLIMLGFDHRRISHRHVTRSLRQQLTRASALPVMFVPECVTETSDHRDASGADNRQNTAGTTARTERSEYV
jgi:nucleotide-binding universal stress UspA family protein